MWPGNYFGVRYWNGRYWAKVGAAPVAGTFVRRMANWRNASRSTWRW